jgi:hypothetical protein
MKKFLIIAIAIFVLLQGCTTCKLEKEKPHLAAIPIVKSLANYAKSNGIVKSFKDIKDFPYKLEPCSKKPNISECKVLKDGYYFIKDNEYYSVNIIYFPNKKVPLGFGLAIIHNTTDCAYEIYFNKKLKKDYSKASCSMIGSCKGWGRQ